MAAPIQRASDRRDAAVHHVAGRHHVGAGCGVTDSGVGQQFHRRIVVHAAVGRQQAAVAVVGVFAQADIGDDHEIGIGVL